MIFLADRFLLFLIALLFFSNPAVAIVEYQAPSKGLAPSWVSPTSIGASLSNGNSVVGGVANLVYSKQYKIESDAVYIYNKQVKKILNKSGREDLSVYEINYFPEYESIELNSFLVKRDGNTINRLNDVEVKMSVREEQAVNKIYDGSVTATILLDDLRVDDVVEVSYTLKTTNQYYVNNAYGAFYFDGSTAVAEQIYRLIVPKQSNAMFKNTNIELEPTKDILGSDIIYTWRLKNSEVVDVRDNAPAWYNPFKRIEFSLSGTWQDASRAEIRLYSQPRSLDKKIRYEIDKIRRSSSSKKIQAQKAIEYVTKNITYLGVEYGDLSFTPASVEATLDSGYADCKGMTYLLVVILRELDIPVNVALVNTYHGQALSDYMPSTLLFNHVIAKITIDNSDYWVDPTIDFQSGNLETLFQPDYGYALVLADNTESLERMPSNVDKVTLDIEESFNFLQGPSDNVKYKVKLKFNYEEAVKARYAIAKYGEVRFVESLDEHYDNIFDGAESYKNSEVIDDSQNNRITFIGYYRLLNLFHKSDDGSQMQADIRPQEIISKLKQFAQRPIKNPYAVSAPSTIQSKSTLYVPKQAVTRPDTVSLSNPAFDFKEVIINNSHTSVLESKLVIKKDSVFPDDYSDVRSDMKVLEESIGMTYSFKYIRG